MAFDIIKKETRVARMIAWLAGIQTTITDFLPGGKTRTKLEAVALELEQQDYQIYRAIQKAIPVALYGAFEFSVIPATRATGSVTFQSASPAAQNITIPEGTRVATTESATNAEKVYETTQEGTLLQGQTQAVVTVAAISPGTFHNTGIGTINVIKTSIPGIDTVTNSASITNGTDREQESARAQRFRDYVASLRRGTAEALEYGAKTAALLAGDGSITERIVYAQSIDDVNGGLVDLYVATQTGAPTQPLIDKAQNIIDGYVDDSGVKTPGFKAAGVVCTVVAATVQTQNVDIALTMEAGYQIVNVGPVVASAINTHMGSLPIGEGLVYNELVEIAMATPGVKDISLTVPAANIAGQIGVMIRPGVITVT